MERKTGQRLLAFAKTRAAEHPCLDPFGHGLSHSADLRITTVPSRGPSRATAGRRGMRPYPNAQDGPEPLHCSPKVPLRA